MGVATAQINVRIDSATKEAGDRELARHNISPSRIVRGVWERMAQGGEDAARVIEATLHEDRSPERQAEIDRKLAALERGNQLFYRFADKLGLDPATHVPLSDDELEEARYQHILEKHGA